MKGFKSKGDGNFEGISTIVEDKEGTIWFEAGMVCETIHLIGFHYL